MKRPDSAALRLAEMTPEQRAVALWLLRTKKNAADQLPNKAAA